MDVRIQNCRIDDFDFGIVVLNNKVPPGGNPGVLARQRNKIVSNTIRSRVMGALLLAADNNQLSDNFISFSSGAGTGISVVRNCAQNQITNNDISSPGNPLEFARQLPGSSSLASLCSDCGIASFDPPAQVLFNVIVSGELYQFPNSVESRNFDNRFEGNIVTLPGTSTGKSHIGIAAGTRSTRTMILRNVVTSGGIGIAAGGFRSDFSGRSPGRCALDASRYCATNSDCQIPAIDPVSKGACVGVTPQSIDARASDSLIEENNLTGPFSTSAISGGDTLDLTVRGNTIHGTGTETGIRLLSASLETATLTRNVIDRASTALFFDHRNGADSRVAPATFFGASVFLNDMTATNSPAIRITNGYSFPSELSVGGQGNYWGHTCAEGGFPAADSPSPLIIDSHPFGTSVASTADSQLPTPCY